MDRDYHTSLNRDAAVKARHPHLATAAVVARLRNTNAIQVYDLASGR